MAHISTMLYFSSFKIKLVLECTETLHICEIKEPSIAHFVQIQESKLLITSLKLGNVIYGD